MKTSIKLIILLLAVACSSKKTEAPLAEVNINTLSKHIERLASDEFLGRKPFTEGENKTVNYLVSEFEKLGLAPGNGDQFTQDVPLVEIMGTPSAKMNISGKQNFDLKYFDDFIASTLKPVEKAALENSELVFAGYGIVAPEYGWNDYAGIDWKGKTAVVLVNDPSFKSGDTTLFKGDKMTYYGRWTYKYEEAGRQGAAGVLIIHDTEPASYGWNVVQASWTGKKLSLETSRPVADVAGWISNEMADKILKAGGINEKDIRAFARKRGFKPIPLGLKASVSITNKVKRDVSKNIAGLIPGTERNDEYIIYSAHWDHLGVGKPVNGDSIYNGAIDNASGVATLLAVAEAFKKEKAPKRSILFLAVTAEEQGLLGSAYYAEHPLFPPDKTVANINMDAMNSLGEMKDFIVVSSGFSEMDRYAREAAEKQGRYIIPDPSPQKGFFFRSDNFNFAKIGIPALYAKGGYEHITKGKDFVKEKKDEYEAKHYHQPSDEFNKETIDLTGARQDAQLMFEIGMRLGNEDYFPKWYNGSEFKAARDKK